MNFLKDYWWITKQLNKNPHCWLLMLIFASPLISALCDPKGSDTLSLILFFGGFAIFAPMLLIFFKTVEWRDYRLSGLSKYEIELVKKALDNK